MVRTRLWLCVVLFLAGGCARGPHWVKPADRRTIDRKVVEYPPDVELTVVVRDLTGPVDAEVDPDGNLIIAEGGYDERDPKLFGVRPDGTVFNIYPPSRTLRIPLINPGFKIHGPIGGIALLNGEIFVSHRDGDGLGVVTAFRYDGGHRTVVGQLPTRGDHSIGDIAVAPGESRLWFGVGSATNSGVVGLDNWEAGWVKEYEEFCDQPFAPLKLLGYQFRTKNPLAGLFGPDDVAVTAPFQPFNNSSRTRGARVQNDRPTAAVYSCSPGGGGLRVEASGVRNALGIAFNEFGSPYMTNQGMKLRGTRPVADDPDVLLKVVQGTWYGWPDFTAHLQPVTEARFQPRPETIIDTGYDEVYFLIDHQASNPPNGLVRPSQPLVRNALLQGVFAPLSGAARLAFVPENGPLAEFRGNAIVALAGDRAPFDTGGRKMIGPTGYKLMRVDVGKREVNEFIRNTVPGPASSHKDPGRDALERPVATCFDAEGNLYIVDFGEMRMKDGEVRVNSRSGRILMLSPPPPPTTQPTAEEALPPSTQRKRLDLPDFDF